MRSYLHELRQPSEAPDALSLCDELLRAGLFQPAEETPNIHFDAENSLYRFMDEQAVCIGTISVISEADLKLVPTHYC
jgi:hypothetical protein